MASQPNEGHEEPHLVDPFQLMEETSSNEKTDLFNLATQWDTVTPVYYFLQVTSHRSPEGKHNVPSNKVYLRATRLQKNCFAYLQGLTPSSASSFVSSHVTESCWS